MLTAVELELPGRGLVRAYGAPEVARALGVTTKTVVSRVNSPLHRDVAGWPPRSDANPTHRWLVEAAGIDRLLTAGNSPVTGDPVPDRAKLAEERQMLEIERAVFQRDRMQQLEDDNTRLRSDVERLRAQVSALGLVVQQLTTESL